MSFIVRKSTSGVPPFFPPESNGRVAQRIRRLTTNQKIVGSNPIVIIFLHGTNELIELSHFSSKIVPLRVGFEPTREDPI